MRAMAVQEAASLMTEKWHGIEAEMHERFNHSEDRMNQDPVFLSGG